MADSMCGPSNALNTFQKHTQLDRTLQQDRLVTRQSPSEGFRSTPGPNAAFLDPEFEAFQAGRPPLESQVPNQFNHAYTHTPPSFQQAPSPFQAGPSGWAADFQNMHITSSGDLRQRTAGTPQALVQNELGGWHQEFARQAGGSATGVANYQQPVQAQGLQNGYAPMNSRINMGQHNLMGGQFMGGFAGQQVAQQPTQPEVFDEEAFARAFEEAEEAELATLQAEPETQTEVEVTTEQTEQQEQVTALDDNVLLSESAERLMEAESHNLNQAPIGADFILPQNQTERNQHNHDDLARTAGELLSNVRGDTSVKFQQSKFLDLMRAFRDKEVIVDGDKIVEKGFADLEGDAERAVGVAKGATEGVVGVQA